MARLIPILETHMTPPPPPPALSPPLALPGASFTPSTTAVGGNVFLTAAVGLLPLVAFFVLMGVFKVKTHWCALISLAASGLIAVLAFGMPAPMAVLSGAQGLAMGFVPIIYIIIAAVWLYNLTETSGRSQDLKAVFNAIGKGDQRAQALIVAFCFCGLLEGLAGFGAPVAITGAMLVTLGLPPVRAAIATIVGNAINVGFGAMAIPVTTAANLGGAGPVEVAADMGRLTWILCLFIPALLLLILDGARGVRQLWPLALVAGGAAALGHFLTPGVSYELTAVVASLLGLTACFVFLLVWTPTTPEEHRTEVAAADRPDGGRVALALLPYVLVVVIIAVTKLWRIGADLSALLSGTDIKIRWPGVYGSLLNAEGRASASAVYTLQTLSNPGTWIFLTAAIVAVVYGLVSSGGRFPASVGAMFAVLPRTVHALRWSILTIATVMALARPPRSARPWRRRGRPSPSCRPSWGGSAPPWRARPRARAPCSPTCRPRRRPARTWIRACCWPPTPSAAGWARSSRRRTWRSRPPPSTRRAPTPRSSGGRRPSPSACCWRCARWSWPPPRACWARWSPSPEPGAAPPRPRPGRAGRGAFRAARMTD